MPGILPPPSPLPSTKLLPGDVGQHLATIAMLRRSKPQFDRLQGWLTLREGRRVNQWEVVEFLLDEAGSAPVGRLVAHDRRARERPKPKAP